MTDSRFARNKHLAGIGAGPLLNFKDADPSFLKLGEGVVTDQKVELEQDQTKRGYLRLVPGTLGAELNARLFRNSAGK